MPTKKVALIHDWLLSQRGGENVLEAIADLFPDADIYTLFHDPKKISAKLQSRTIHVSSLNKFPGVHRFYRYLLPFLPLAIERFDLSRYDVVISSSHCVAKGVIVRPDAVHICYCHTPMRYVWDRVQDYFAAGFSGLLIAPILTYLRIWDVTSSARVDHFIANSEFVGARIRKYYRRDSEVIFPFVDLTKILLKDRKSSGDYYLAVSALVPYKRLDLAAAACERLGRELRIVGGDHKRTLGKFTRFLGRVSEEELADLYQGARALLFPGEEDAGIVPLEAMAAGTPVIAYARGGVTETVVEATTGFFFPTQTVESLCAAIVKFEAAETQFSKQACRDRAAQFSKEIFQAKFLAFCRRFF